MDYVTMLSYNTCLLFSRWKYRMSTHAHHCVKEKLEKSSSMWIFVCFSQSEKCFSLNSRGTIIYKK